jgi:hypothetical protein
MTQQEKQFVLDCARDHYNAIAVLYYESWHGMDIVNNSFEHAITMLEEARKQGLFEPNS